MDDRGETGDRWRNGDGSADGGEEDAQIRMETEKDRMERWRMQSGGEKRKMEDEGGKGIHGEMEGDNGEKREREKEE